jgi:hypothetical protein
MEVRELIAELQELPQDAWVDASFGTGSAYAVTGTEALALPDGRVLAIVNIFDGVPLVAV